MRRSLQDAADAGLFTSEDFIAGLELLGGFGYTFDVCIRHEQLRGATELARRVPGVTFVLDHLGKPDVRRGMVEPWASDLREFAALPNTVCKISGLATEADWQHWRRAHLKFYLIGRWSVSDSTGAVWRGLAGGDAGDDLSAVGRGRARILRLRAGERAAEAFSNQCGKDLSCLA